jgi:DNA-binding transcriptional regulator YhcF (GntR family)
MDNRKDFQKEAILELTRTYLKEATQLGYSYQEIFSIIESIQAESSQKDHS